MVEINKYYAPDAIESDKVSSPAKIRSLKTYLTDSELQNNGFAVSAYSTGQSARVDISNVIYLSFKDKNDSHGNQWLVHRPANAETAEAQDHPWLAALEKRVDDLRAVTIDEQLAFDETSAGAALAFVRRLHNVRRPGAFLVDGNIRLVWDKPEGQQVGLQFRGSDKIQFVIFQADGDDLGSLMGLRSTDAVYGMITARGIFPLIANA